MSGNEPVTYIEWIDSAGLDGWTARSELAESSGISRVRSVGLLVSEDDESVTVVAGIDDTHGNVHNPLTIPKFAITAREQLRDSRQ